MARSNPGIGKLLGAMRKLIVEVNDQEICRRLEILQNSEKEDLPVSVVKRLLEEPGEFDAREIQEPYTQYVKHYLYMVKRSRREEARGDRGGAVPGQKTARRKVARKKTTATRKKSSKTSS